MPLGIILENKNPEFETLKSGDIEEGNYLEIEADGTDVRKGDATVWDDIVNSLIGSRLFSTAGKVDYDYSENAVNFQSGGSIAVANDRVIFNLQYPHAALSTGKMKLHAHWEQVNTNKIEFTVQYRIQKNNAVKTTDWTTVTSDSDDDSVYTYPGSGTFNQIIELAEIDMTDEGLSATVQFRVVRTDSTNGDIFVTFIDAHIESDMLGSRSEYIK